MQSRLPDGSLQGRGLALAWPLRSLARACCLGEGASYKAWSDLLGVTLTRTRAIMKVCVRCVHEEEQETWLKKKKNVDFKHWIRLNCLEETAVLVLNSSLRGLAIPCRVVKLFIFFLNESCFFFHRLASQSSLRWPPLSASRLPRATAMVCRMPSPPLPPPPQRPRPIASPMTSTPSMPRTAPCSTATRRTARGPESRLGDTTSCCRTLES